AAKSSPLKKSSRRARPPMKPSSRRAAGRPRLQSLPTASSLPPKKLKMPKPKKPTNPKEAKKRNNPPALTARALLGIRNGAQFLYDDHPAPLCNHSRLKIRALFVKDTV